MEDWAGEYLGRQVLADLYDCNVDALKGVDIIRNIMLQAAAQGHATIVSESFRQFDPWGVSGMLIVQESHIAIHTWPEYGYAAIDAFTCGKEMNPSVVIESIARSLSSKIKIVREEFRGSRTSFKGVQ
jgi:S-adenosylmethionine decarboxylase proenzyme